MTNPHELAFMVRPKPGENTVADTAAELGLDWVRRDPLKFREFGPGEWVVRPVGGTVRGATSAESRRLNEANGHRTGCVGTPASKPPILPAEIEDAIRETEFFMDRMAQGAPGDTGRGFPAGKLPPPRTRESEAKCVLFFLMGFDRDNRENGPPPKGIAQKAARRAWGDAIPSNIALALDMEEES